MHSPIHFPRPPPLPQVHHLKKFLCKKLGVSLQLEEVQILLLAERMVILPDTVSVGDLCKRALGPSRDVILYYKLR